MSLGSDANPALDAQSSAGSDTSTLGKHSDSTSLGLSYQFHCSRTLHGCCSHSYQLRKRRRRGRGRGRGRDIPSGSDNGEWTEKDNYIRYDRLKACLLTTAHIRPDPNVHHFSKDINPLNGQFDL